MRNDFRLPPIWLGRIAKCLFYKQLLLKSLWVCVPQQHMFIHQVPKQVNESLHASVCQWAYVLFIRWVCKNVATHHKLPDVQIYRGAHTNLSASVHTQVLIHKNRFFRMIWPTTFQMSFPVFLWIQENKTENFTVKEWNNLWDELCSWGRWQHWRSMDI